MFLEAESEQVGRRFMIAVGSAVGFR